MLNRPISTTTMAITRHSIQLDKREQQLRDLLVDVAKSIDATGKAKEPLVLRWAGGWVRDKLLGLESHDIDIAINSMTGEPFVQYMCDFCTQPDVIQRHGIGAADIGNLHKVKSNPDKSKHLETAMIPIFGLEVDVVNLRKESYAEDSRNPTIEFGTAEEDALRRDATINAMFYNLHTQEVEDFTTGLQDLQDHVIRTPLDPLQTFRDDPLRVLRLVRFSSRLSFPIDAGTQKYMTDQSVLEALKIKISRERVGIELEKMFKGMHSRTTQKETGLNTNSASQDKHPRLALEIIDKLGLYSAIFTDPAKPDLEVPDTSRWSVAYNGLDDIIQNDSPGSLGELLVRADDAKFTAWNLIAVSPWTSVEDAPGTKKKPMTSPPVRVIAREGFKASNKLTDIMAACHYNREEILQLKNAVINKEPYINERDKFGMAIRRWDERKTNWRLQVVSTMLIEAMGRLQEWPSTVPQGRVDEKAVKQREDFVQEWQAFMDHLSELDVMEAPSLKPLVDGRVLSEALGVKSGRWTGPALNVCVAWQLRNPKETDPQGAIDEVKSRKEELGITG